jgi:antitoxin CptB
MRQRRMCKADSALYPRYMRRLGSRISEMTGTRRSSEGLDSRRRKLLFRSWHRGIREMDLVLGGFADATIHALTDAELDQYEGLLEAQDADILSWITGVQSIPPLYDNAVFARILASRQAAAL